MVKKLRIKEVYEVNPLTTEQIADYKEQERKFQNLTNKIYDLDFASAIVGKSLISTVKSKISNGISKFISDLNEAKIQFGYLTGIYEENDGKLYDRQADRFIRAFQEVEEAYNELKSVMSSY